MRIPFGKAAEAAKLGAATMKQGDEPIRVAVAVDATATRFLIETVRDAFVPRTTTAIVRVGTLDDCDRLIKNDTDIVLVLSCGSVGLQKSIQRLVIAGAPVAVIAESSVEIPFIESDTRMLGLIASTDKTNLLESLARWILDRTEKEIAFAANFPFMRIAAANRVMSSCALTNLATGALVFVPGADYPVMVAAQMGMMLQLASIFGKPISVDRAYEAAGILLSGYALRIVSRAICRSAGHLSFVVKALIAGGGTYLMGRALTALYERDVSYEAANELLFSGVSFVREAFSKAQGLYSDTVQNAA